nr:transposase [Candidatus Sigynarchaeota archaeon]
MLERWLPRAPKFIIVDFKPAWESAVKQVFPNAIIIICTFHAEKLLVHAIVKEFSRLKKGIDAGFIKGCTKLRDLTIKLEKEGVLEDTGWIEHNVHRKWFDFYLRIEALNKVDDVETYTREHGALVAVICAWDEDIARDFSTRLAPYIPRRGFTLKGLKYFKPKLQTAWRMVLHGLRLIGEENTASFWNGRYIVLKKPSNMAPADRDMLRAYLARYPFMRMYRETLRRFYRLFDDQGKGTPSLDFLDAIVQEDSHDSLRAAVKTLQSKVEQVFNYRKLATVGIDWKQNKAARVNSEHVNTRINKLARNAFGFRLWENARFRLEGFLECPVVISQALINNVE